MKHMPMDRKNGQPALCDCGRYALDSSSGLPLDRDARREGRAHRPGVPGGLMACYELDDRGVPRWLPSKELTA